MTRSVITIFRTFTTYKKGKKDKLIIKGRKHFIIVKIYNHVDGYIAGVGKKLADFLKKIMWNKKHGQCTFLNTAEHIAAETVAYFKNEDDNDNVSLVAIDCTSCGEYYNYDVYIDDIKNKLKIVVKNFGKVIYKGDLKNFKAKD